MEMNINNLHDLLKEAAAHGHEARDYCSLPPMSQTRSPKGWMRCATRGTA